MPLTSADHALLLYQSDRFRGWLKVLIGNVARDVYVEADTVPYHAERLALAARALTNPTQLVEQFLNALIGDPEVALLGSIQEDSWGDTHLLQLRAKMVALWTPVARTSLIVTPAASPGV